MQFLESLSDRFETQQIKNLIIVRETKAIFVNKKKSFAEFEKKNYMMTLFLSGNVFDSVVLCLNRAYCVPRQYALVCAIVGWDVCSPLRVGGL